MPASKHRLIRWPSNQGLPRMEDLEETLTGEGHPSYRMVDPPCTYYHDRVLERAETRWVIRGRVMIGLGDEQIELQAGDRIDLSKGQRVWIRVVSDDGASYLLALHGRRIQA